MGYFSIPVHQFFPICFAQCFDCIIPVFNSLLRMFVSSAFHPCPLLNYALCQMTVWQKPPNLGDSEKKAFYFDAHSQQFVLVNVFYSTELLKKKFYFLMGYYCQNNYCNFLRRDMACMYRNFLSHRIWLKSTRHIVCDLYISNI